jgi:uncharacterized membrane protein
MTEIGPVQMVAIGFGPDAKFEGQIVEELVRLENERSIRLLDLLFVLKDTDSDELVVLEHEAQDLGGIVGALLGFEFEGHSSSPGAGTGGPSEHVLGMSQSDLEEVAAGLAPGESAGFLLIEHVWARGLKRVIRDAGGVPIAEGFLTPESVRFVEPELVAMAEAMNEVESERAATAGA